MLSLRAYRKEDAKTIAAWSGDEQTFLWWSAGKLGEYPLDPDVLDAFYAPGVASGDWFPRVMEEDGCPCGQMLMRWQDKAEGILHFGFILVNPALRGRGLGQAMLCMALEYAFHLKRAKRVTLNVFADNAPAIRLYERLGFSRAQELEIPVGEEKMRAYRYEKRAHGA